MSETESKIKYLHKIAESHVKNGKRTTREEFLIDGSKGFSMKYYSKEDDKKIKVHAKGSDGKYELTITDGDKKDKKTVTKEELMKELKNMGIDFAYNYMKGAKDTKKTQMRHNVKRSSKKQSKPRKWSRK